MWEDIHSICLYEIPIAFLQDLKKEPSKPNEDIIQKEDNNYMKIHM